MRGSRFLAFGFTAGLIALTLAAGRSERRDPREYSQTSGVTAEEPCLMTPGYSEIRLQKAGHPDDISPEKWTRGSTGTLDLLVYADGPEGSGRYWSVSVGVAEKGRRSPLRRARLETSTVGWRTLLDFKGAPLPWIDDVDSDGNAELIIWDSFPLPGQTSMAEFGLVAWVYRLASADTLVIDWTLSRKMAGDIALAYRAPASEGSARLRALSAAALEAFASAKCRPTVQPAR